MASASKNIFWLTISRIIALILLFIAYTQLFRYLGPYTSGQYQFVLSYVAIFGVIIDFGLQQYIIKKISESPSEVKKYFQNFLAVEVVLALFIYGLLLTIAKLNNYEPIVFNAIAVAGLGTALNGLTYPFLSVMSAFYDLRKVALINFINSLINVATIFSVIYFHKSIVLLSTNLLVFFGHWSRVVSWFRQKIHSQARSVPGGFVSRLVVGEENHDCRVSIRTISRLQYDLQSH
jgi:O-antigen/teichoic acid export membrane protein